MKGHLLTTQMLIINGQDPNAVDKVCSAIQSQSLSLLIPIPDWSNATPLGSQKPS
jgi:hypothetical protein